ncbi:alpha-L-fucosidase [Sinomicrobium weinanense]|uniref:alpha-L-fucosidase n=1 Tax=Sinomicrobium weinanense TaxID=2842200 RepID=A0A926JT59_9FLAO|nr:alpha-L-fucosidase [Sinomicrobium weinanense]MBC9796782.1 alpha-L-fucosidase [Sinomicrobium weinanense]MBU3125531.1 alpha-L-fucosidase [Sinomicrobium weinanense]
MKIIKTLFLLVLCNTIMAQENYVPAKENLEAREWFQDAKFGMFIHWGVYSIPGDGEWVMQRQDIPVDRYELLPSFFNPQDFDAKEVVSLAKEAGMKYITITTKHHDGFAMYDSKVSDYNIVKATPYGKDILRMLEQECEKQGIKLFAYYSQLDWHHPDYYPRGWTGRKTGRPESGDWETYLKYQDAQIRELAENYNIAGFWFDGWWDQAPHKKDWHKAVEYRIKGADWKLGRTYKMIHDVNPALLIGNNHHELPIKGEDFQMFEKDLPGKNTSGFGGADIGQLPLETCETINHSWGFNLQDGKHKSVKNLIRYLVKAAGNNANFLLNVGPMPNGDIQQEHKERLKAIGEWINTNGKTVYGTRKGPVNVENKIVSTQKDKTVYLHILDTEGEEAAIEGFGQKIKKAVMFKDQSPVKHRLKKGTLYITVPADKQNDVDTIVEITLK